MVHAAISGSTNALIHVPAIAHEFGISIDGDTFDRIHRGAKYLLDIRPAGRWPAEFFYYAGGVPAIMDEIRMLLHLDAMTITGKTLGENLDELKANGFYEHCHALLLDKANARRGIKLTRADIIRSFATPSAPTAASPSCAATWPRKAVSSSTPPAPRPCSRRPSRPPLRL